MNVIGHFMMEFNELASDMAASDQTSPWHREGDVWKHTMMVLEEFGKLSHGLTPREILMGQVVSLFHDIGKPQCRTVFERDGQPRVSFKGHELVSARMAHNILFDPDNSFYGMFNNDDKMSILWMIENHLPWNIKKKPKLAELARFEMFNLFQLTCTADALGRIADVPSTHESCMAFFATCVDALIDEGEPNHLVRENEPDVILLVGASGAGKTTWVKNHTNPKSTVIFSYDRMRLRDAGYNPDNHTIQQYRDAFAADPHYDKWHQEYRGLVSSDVSSVVVDNTNVSRKRRRFFIDEARKHRRLIKIVYFSTPEAELLARIDSRPDKRVPTDAILRQHNSVQIPNRSEYDFLEVA